MLMTPQRLRDAGADADKEERRRLDERVSNRILAAERALQHRAVGVDGIGPEKQENGGATSRPNPPASAGMRMGFRKSRLSRRVNVCMVCYPFVILFERCAESARRVPRSDCQMRRDHGEPLKNRSMVSLLTRSSGDDHQRKGSGLEHLGRDVRKGALRETAGRLQRSENVCADRAANRIPSAKDNDGERDPAQSRRRMIGPAQLYEQRVGGPAKPTSAPPTSV